MDKQQRIAVIKKVEGRLREVYQKRMIIIGAIALVVGFLLGWGASALGLLPVGMRDVEAAPSDTSLSSNDPEATSVPQLWLPTYSPEPVVAVPTDMPTPTPDPAIAAQYTTVQKGDTSDAVKDVQARLIELGYLSGDADGIFGSGTKSAVSTFQKAVDLSETGIADEATQSRLFAEDAPKAD